jgi:hypothetical protein
MRPRPTAHARAATSHASCARPLSCPGRAQRDTDLGLARDRQLDDASRVNPTCVDLGATRQIAAGNHVALALYCAGSRLSFRSASPLCTRPGHESMYPVSSRTTLQDRNAWGAPEHARRYTSKADRRPYALSFSGTLPPLSASLVMTWRCSQTFISDEPSSAPV